MVSIFDILVELMKGQPDVQRLLFLFTSAKESRKPHLIRERQGLVTPTMVVDELPCELRNFNSLVKEVDSINNDWDFVFISVLGGNSDSVPSREEADYHLRRMCRDVASGKNINRYVVLGRNENLIKAMPY